MASLSLQSTVITVCTNHCNIKDLYFSIIRRINSDNFPEYAMLFLRCMSLNFKHTYEMCTLEG